MKVPHLAESPFVISRRRVKWPGTAGVLTFPLITRDPKIFFRRSPANVRYVDHPTEMRFIKKTRNDTSARALPIGASVMKRKNHVGGSCFNIAINHSRRSNENLCHKRADCR